MKLSPQAKEQLQAEPAKFIEQEIKEFTLTSPSNRLSFIKDYIIFDEPLVKFADGSGCMDCWGWVAPGWIALANLTVRRVVGLLCHYVTNTYDGLSAGRWSCCCWRVRLGATR